MPLVNLLLLASLEERFTYRKLDCILGARNNMLEGENLADEAVENVFALVWEAVTLPAEEALFCFWK